MIDCNSDWMMNYFIKNKCINKFCLIVFRLNVMTVGLLGFSFSPNISPTISIWYFFNSTILNLLYFLLLIKYHILLNILNKTRTSVVQLDNVWSFCWDSIYRIESQFKNISHLFQNICVFKGKYIYVIIRYIW